MLEWDAGTGLVHTIEVTPANTHDITVASKLIRSDDEVVYGDSGFVGIQKRPEIKENEHLASIDYRIVRRPGSLPKVSDNAIDWERFIDHRKASIRCKVEHVFRIVKRQFGYAKTAYRGLQKNANRLYALFLSSISTCWHMQDGLSKTRDRLIRGVLCPFGPLGADYRESEFRKRLWKGCFRVQICQL